MTFVHQDRGMRWYWLIFAVLAALAVIEGATRGAPIAFLAALVLAGAALWAYRLAHPRPPDNGAPEQPSGDPRP